MKYIAIFFALMAAPVNAHSTVLPHAHEASLTPMMAGLAVTALCGLVAFRYARGEK